MTLAEGSDSRKMALAQYRALVREHEVDLLIMETKDEDQLAMHGLAHPLAIEIREIPLLMI